MPQPTRLSDILGAALDRTSPCPHGHGPAPVTVAIPHAGDFITRHRCHRCKGEWTHEPAEEVAA
jgi:hypothetical protein